MGTKIIGMALGIEGLIKSAADPRRPTAVAGK
jgi:hypothetical protein